MKAVSLLVTDIHLSQLHSFKKTVPADLTLIKALWQKEKFRH